MSNLELASALLLVLKDSLMADGTLNKKDTEIILTHIQELIDESIKECGKIATF